MVNPSSNNIRDKREEKIAISRAEICVVILLVLAGMGSWVWVDRGVPVLLKDREPREEQIKERFLVPQKQAEALMTENERRAIEEQLIKARLEQGTQSSTTAALTAAFPELMKSPAAVAKPISIPTETVQAYKDAHIKELIANRLVQSLSERLEIVKTHAIETSAALEQSQHASKTEFVQSHATYMLTRRVLTFAGSVMIALLLVLFVRWVVAPRTGQGFAMRSRLTFPLVLGALFILFAYQSFELAGAALVAVVVLLVLFSNYIPFPATK